MCYDISFHSSLKAIQDYLPEAEYKITEPLTFEQVFHILGHNYFQHPVIVNENGKLVVVPYEWGVVTNYMRTPEDIKRLRPTHLNFRSEKLLDKSSYWYRIRKNRCLVPMDGFFEHQKVKGFKKKVPYHIRIREENLFFTAGLYAFAPHPITGQPVGTFAFGTEDANSLMRQIHNDGPNAFRMPLILDKSMIRDWLNPNLTDRDLLDLISFQMPSERMEAWPVKQIRGISKPNDESVLAEEIYPGLPPLNC